MNEILSCKAGLEKETIMTRLMDALTMLGTANIELNYFRREMIKPEMKSEYGIFAHSQRQ